MRFTDVIASGGKRFLLPFLITVDGFSGVGVWGGGDTLNVFSPFGKSAIFSYHSVNSAIISCHLVTSATVLYQVTAFWFDVQCADGKIKISGFIFVISLALKLNKSLKVIIIRNVIRGSTL